MWHGFRALDRWLGGLPLVRQLALAFATVLVIMTPLLALSAPSFAGAVEHAVYWAALGIMATLLGHRIAQRRRGKR